VPVVSVVGDVADVVVESELPPLVNRTTPTIRAIPTSKQRATMPIGPRSLGGMGGMEIEPGGGGGGVEGVGAQR
jgi:hypothetical protein